MPHRKTRLKEGVHGQKRQEHKRKHGIEGRESRQSKRKKNKRHAREEHSKLDTDLRRGTARDDGRRRRRRESFHAYCIALVKTVLGKKNRRGKGLRE